MKASTQTQTKEPGKGLIYLALGEPQEFFKQHLIKNEEQLLCWKIYSVHFGGVLSM